MPASDYSSILEENKKRYGTDIGRIGPMLLAERYADRTHFIYELLQNAEDALARRKDWNGHRAVEFALSKTSLRVSHFGIPFTEADVRGICGIAESTKNLTSIGRFGIGFKSVYAFTDCPEVHSGDEHFAVDSFVWPREIQTLQGKTGETTFILPLRPTDITAHSEIATGLSKLGARTLLFLREIEEISWSVDGGPSGLYLRDKPLPFGDIGRKIVVIGQVQDKKDMMEETWLVFSREVSSAEGIVVGHVEIAFGLVKDRDDKSLLVHSVSDSTLVVFFPTIVPTNLGLLVQGPYRTTPSRDNVPRNDPWNQHLVRESAILLTESLRLLRKNGLLNADAMLSLPLDRSKFAEGSMFAPLFNMVRDALSVEPLLPCIGGSHVSAKSARLGRTKELRELINPSQLATILETEADIHWLTDEITRDKMPELRRYLMQELDIVEITPEMIIPKLSRSFLEVQTDEWIVSLYDFLNAQPARQRQLDDIPLIRLEDGTHVTAKVNGILQAFLPSSIITDFPTVRRSVCSTEEARKFLESIGLSEPDPVDDVIRNVLPKYAEDEVNVEEVEYAIDVNRILKAFVTDSKVQREKLIEALRESNIIMVVDPGGGSKRLSKPGNVYLATQRLKELFEGVQGVLLVDDSLSCLRGENVRELLESCGASRYLQPISINPEFTWNERRVMRQNGGCEDCTYDFGIDDYTLRGLQELLNVLPNLDAVQARKRVHLLWEALRDVEDRRGAAVFNATYRWKYHYTRSYEFDATFVRILNETAWIPRDSVPFERPCYVIFDETGLRRHAFLLSKIRFKPPIIETLAREAGFEPGMLDLLKKLGVTSEAELKARLGIKNDNNEDIQEGEYDKSNLPEEASKGSGITEAKSEAESSEDEPSPGSLSTLVTDAHSGSGIGHKSKLVAGEKVPSGDSHNGSTVHGGESKGPKFEGRISNPFISYVGVHREENESDPDGLLRENRMVLEENAIALIIKHEPQLLRTPVNNPGFDLIEKDEQGNTIRWIEVKAMTHDMRRQPVGLSKTQFECAREYKLGYWLYVVEHAGIESEARILKIQDPVGKARSFTFDHGWISVAEIDSIQ